MSSGASSLLVAAALFLGMIALSEIGRRLALMGGRSGNDPEGSEGFSVIDGAIFGLLGLIVAFSFSGAAGRFDERRELIGTETNAIGSAYQLLDLLPGQPRSELQQHFRDYLDARIALYRVLPDIGAAAVELDAARTIKTRIWTMAVAATDGDQPATMLLLPAINGMFDIATSRTLSTMMHPPQIVFVLMFLLALISALVAGYGMASRKRREWPRLCGFAAIASITFYVILDLEFPRSGLIQIQAFDLALVDLRANME